MLSKKSHDIIDPLIQISMLKYNLFCQRLKSEIPSALSLDIFKNELTKSYVKQLCREIFSDEIKNTIHLLNNDSISIAAIDIPETSLFDKMANAVYGAAIALGIFNNIGNPTIDTVNATPFTLHTASHHSGKLLESTDYTPDAKLGFHNDGLLNAGSLQIPNHIVIYNLFINYLSPGKFRWVPTALWDDMDKYGSIAKSENIKIKVRLTPYYHINEDGKLEKTELDYIEIPISNIDSNGQRSFFLNGKVLASENAKEHVDFVQAIRNSLENNSIIISIEQKERRAFYLKNTMGFHARDIFKEPIEGIDLTRVFLRSVDENAKTYPSRKFKFEN